MTKTFQEPTIRISAIWPPTPDCTHVEIYAHRDGRRVQYVRGWCKHNEAQEKLLAERGNISGTLGSIDYWECFPDEQVCQGCVALEQSYNMKPDGTKGNSWMTSSPSFKTGVRSGFCPPCREREAARVRERYERDMKTLGIDP